MTAKHLLGIFPQGDERNEYGYRVGCDVLRMMTSLEKSAFETKIIYVKQWPLLDFKKYTRRYNHYYIRAANIQDHYPPRFIQSDGTIDQGRHKSTIGAMKVAVRGKGHAVVLKIADDVLSANIVTHFQGESLEEIVHSYDSRESVCIK
jgi:hypothetical protein